MSNYKLYYLNFRGKGETSRMLFVLADQTFDDVRQEQEEWLKDKPEHPYFERPILEYDGCKVLAHYRAIERLLAKRFNLYGSTESDQSKTDMLIGALIDMEKPLIEIFLTEDPHVKGVIVKKYQEEKMPNLFKYIERMLGSTKYYLGDQISWGDVALHNTMHYFDILGWNITEMMDKHPKINALLESVAKHPKIAEWLEKHPV